MKYRSSIILFLLMLSTTVFGQNRNVFPIWTYHQNNLNIHGISIGIGSVRGEPRNVNTNGIKVELIGAGILVPLIPESPVAQKDSIFEQDKNDPISETINGLSLSAFGTVCDCITNGLSLGLIGQIKYRVNGVSGSFLMNFAQVHRGVQFAFAPESYLANGLQIGVLNYGHKMKGLQIGLFNKSNDLKGLQIGLWNINQKRKRPLINWM